MQNPTLSRPLLLGTPWSHWIEGVDALAGVLGHQYTVEDLEPIQPSLIHAARVRLEVAAAEIGEIAVTSVLGLPMAMAVQPLKPLCMLALPSVGWGRYQIDDCCLDNTTGETIAYIPSFGWRLINDNTGGTAVQFQLESLITRIRAIADTPIEASVLTGLLSVPMVVKTADAHVSYYYQQLLAALSMLDNTFRYGLGEPDPNLRLDDLILRCAALLLYPQLDLSDNVSEPVGTRHDLSRTVLQLMDWMRANIHRPISLTQIEQRTHFGRRAIQLGFKAQVGCGPMQWLRRQRLEHALSRLQIPDGTTTVTQVAHACGYLSLASFSRDFRERFGRSAREVLFEARNRHTHHGCGD